jgi:hypothetical protein
MNLDKLCGFENFCMGPWAPSMDDDGRSLSGEFLSTGRLTDTWNRHPPQKNNDKKQEYGWNGDNIFRAIIIQRHGDKFRR